MKTHMNQYMHIGLGMRACKVGLQKKRESIEFLYTNLLCLHA